ncbi:hypothetical protein BLD49_01230 [Erwinia sp. OLMDSP33]|nr:hypothetical protein BV501_01250 [Erwinia sp. OAMSP11]PIJ75206.1 hypothetical protein BK416_02170 [Erwinia sp. OLSSP12]PIJ84413.1 hypothetical protein BLD47_02065 [Erwinia sp. OLCASP19]PIJ87027.1 hypothetical protein BLD46_01650 [Erwinia sp. OLMTSP26]PIJ88590.1 hypothetical protein BLD49_01230 [Erwinia sp. OLMDSP33]PIJ90692.1 hypothetical protein BL249_11620 [Erwinia sp. OLFS4]
MGHRKRNACVKNAKKWEISHKLARIFTVCASDAGHCLIARQHLMIKITKTDGGRKIDTWSNRARKNRE